MCNDIREKVRILHSIIDTPGIGSSTLNSLLDKFDSLENIINASNEDIKQVLTSTRFKNFSGFSEVSDARIDNQISRMEKSGAKLLMRYDEGYPSSLLHIKLPPPFIYIRGNIEKRDEVAIGVVGRRQMTSYGEEATNKIVSKLASSGVTIVSGFAYGIDTTAHKAAIQAHGRTIAVLGCGVDICYPSSNDKLYYELLDYGAIISEFPMGTQPAPHNFPSRNRIISALSLGVLVIEADIRSGSLITANFAKNQKKEVFAVPGYIFESSSAGTNKLIKNGAKLVTDADDIMTELGIEWVEKDSPKMSTQLPLNLPDKQLQIMNNLTSIPISADNLSRVVNMKPAQLLAELSILELNGFVAQKPGKQFIRKV